MKKIYLLLFILFFVMCGATYSHAKYILNCSAKVLHIEYFDENPSENRPATLSGKILTENLQGHYSLVTLYKTSDVNHEQPISQMETNEDGSFCFENVEKGVYDVVVSKEIYLNYTVLAIKLRPARNVVLDDYLLIAGDFEAPFGSITIYDWNAILRNRYKPLTESNKLFDINCDGFIDKLDSDIVYKNYLKNEEIIVWKK